MSDVESDAKPAKAAIEEQIRSTVQKMRELMMKVSEGRASVIILGVEDEDSGETRRASVLHVRTDYDGLYLNLMLDSAKADLVGELLKG